MGPGLLRQVQGQLWPPATDKTTRADQRMAVSLRCTAAWDSGCVAPDCSGVPDRHGHRRVRGDALVDGHGRLPLAMMARMTAAFEVSPDDPQQVADAIARAAEGAVVHLVRDGRAVADIVPATAQPGRAPRDPRHIQISQMMAQRFGAPTLADYRRAYDSSRTSWPGDDYIRRNHPVADAS
jgi:antitoxin (DNA-binding transcriptional repressor) of toxin-antitoxin stability system